MSVPGWDEILVGALAMEAGIAGEVLVFMHQKVKYAKIIKCKIMNSLKLI